MLLLKHTIVLICLLSEFYTILSFFSAAILDFGSHFEFFIANTHMCLLYGICIVLNSVPLSFDLTVDGPRPWQLNTQFSKKSNSTRTGERNHFRW